MIFSWLSGKMRFLSHLGAFLLGMIILIAPWYVLLIVLAVSLLLDYLAFSFEYKEKSAAE